MSKRFYDTFLAVGWVFIASMLGATMGAWAMLPFGVVFVLVIAWWIGYAVYDAGRRSADKEEK